MEPVAFGLALGGYGTISALLFRSADEHPAHTQSLCLFIALFATVATLICTINTGIDAYHRNNLRPEWYSPLKASEADQVKIDRLTEQVRFQGSLLLIFLTITLTALFAMWRAELAMRDDSASPTTADET